ncbi:MAG: HAMP domain-containing protein [Granulosicoccus sp.]|nr:HAMP domain-containing protein [Granulosicoccus sp.]
MISETPDQSPATSCSDEPGCLVTPESKWYRPGIGFTCQQIMLPLVIVALFLAVILAFQTVNLFVNGLGLWGIAHFLITVCMLALTLRAIWFVRKSLIQPLAQIRQWVSQVRGGQFSARMPPFAPGEFNDLAKDINQLADLVQNLHEDLEGEVATQTERLARKTDSLALLYEVVTEVNESDEPDNLLRHIMQRLSEAYSAKAVVLRVLSGSKLKLVDSFGLRQDSPFMEEAVSIQSVLKSQVFGEGQIGVRNQILEQRLISGGDNLVPLQVISIPFQYRDSIHGSFQLFVATDFEFDSDCRELLSSVGQHLGVMMEQSRLDAETGKLMLVEERARLANELHDSLAQTLASLRFQVRVLDETLHQGDEQVTWEELEKLEEQVEVANKELRSLIGQVRAPLQSQDIVVSTRKLVNKFEQDTGVTVYLQNEWTEDNLPVEQRIDVVRIVQEALANIRKHANASSVRVVIRNSGKGYRIVVEDDGRGYDEPVKGNDNGEHIGQSIMKERAERLGATLQLDSEPGEGSSVILEYQYPPLEEQPLAVNA